MPLIEVRQTVEFMSWLEALRDAQARKRISQRVERLAAGLLGDAKSVGKGVMELRVDYGPGYRAYFTRRGNRLVLLLCGGDKASQARDIARAQAMASEWEDD